MLPVLTSPLARCLHGREASIQRPHPARAESADPVVLRWSWSFQKAALGALPIALTSRAAPWASSHHDGAVTKQYRKHTVDPTFPSSREIYGGGGVRRLLPCENVPSPFGDETTLALCLRAFGHGCGEGLGSTVHSCIGGQSTGMPRHARALARCLTWAGTSTRAYLRSEVQQLTRVLQSLQFPRYLVRAIRPLRSPTERPPAGA